MPPHELVLYDDTGQFLSAALQAIAGARHRAMVETYIVRDDVLGRDLMRALKRAAANGADARMLYDPSGSSDLPTACVQELSSAGVSTRAYGESDAFLGLLRPGFRDHARAVVADDVAFTGGHAWGREWLPRARGGDGWRDIECRVKGPVVEDWVKLFLRRWKEARSGWPAAFDTGRRYPDLRLLSDGPGRRRPLLREHVRAFGRARRRIWLGNAYFFPPFRFARALSRAARRGVDVTVIVPRESDLPTVRRAARSQYASWLRRGIHVREYTGAVLHAKYAVVDDDWCTVGSYNAIGTAGTLTVETNLVVTDRAFVQAVAGRFETDLEQARAVDRAQVDGRPPLVRLGDLAARILLKSTARLAGAQSF